MTPERSRSRKDRMGLLGEAAAAEELVRMGYRLLERNYRCRGGEADLVAEVPTPDGRTLVFVEVKTRSTLRGGLPAEAVGWMKQRRLARAAGHYLAEREVEDRPIRFDVVEVIVLRGEVAGVAVHPNAFVPEEEDCP